MHDIGGDLQNFCMTGPSGRDLYKTYPDLQGLGKKKKKKTRSTNTNCNFSGEMSSLALKIVLLVGALPVRLGRELGVAGLSM